MIETVAAKLGELKDGFVFVGGATTVLFITDPAVTEIRPTKDIDLIVEVASFAKFAKIEEKLREKGFHNVIEKDAPICRWQVEEVLVDVMPAKTGILGFSNRWYQPAVEERITRYLPSGMDIQLVRPEYFIATKLEAFIGRGEGDFIMSHDIEDIITVIDGRPEIIEEIESSGNEVRSFIHGTIKSFTSDTSFENAVLGYLPNDSIGQKRYNLLMDRIKKIGS